jgi:argininosuccinate lyase
VPSSYNKDLQEDKEPLLDTLDTLHALLPVLAGLIATLQPQAERMRAALDDALLATDLADYLVRRGVPFRQAHHLVGQAVSVAEKRDSSLRDLPLDYYRQLYDGCDESLYEVFDFERSIESKASGGGTGRAGVMAQLEAARQLLA